LKQIKGLFKHLNLQYVKVNSPKNGSYAFVTFVNEEAKSQALKILNGYAYKGKELLAIVTLYSLKKKCKNFILKISDFISQPNQHLIHTSSLIAIGKIKKEV
jgi:hypothetical protein